MVGYVKQDGNTEPKLISEDSYISEHAKDYTNMSTLKLGSMQYIPTYIHTYTHTYTQTYIHTYIHTYILYLLDTDPSASPLYFLGRDNANKKDRNPIKQIVITITYTWAVRKVSERSK
jgi:hypothetical protein